MLSSWLANALIRRYADVLKNLDSLGLCHRFAGPISRYCHPSNRAANTTLDRPRCSDYRYPRYWPGEVGESYLRRKKVTAVATLFHVRAIADCLPGRYLAYLACLTVALPAAVQFGNAQRRLCDRRPFVHGFPVPALRVWRGRGISCSSNEA